MYLKRAKEDEKDKSFAILLTIRRQHLVLNLVMLNNTPGKILSCKIRYALTIFQCII